MLETDVVNGLHSIVLVQLARQGFLLNLEPIHRMWQPQLITLYSSLPKAILPHLRIYSVRLPQIREVPRDSGAWRASCLSKCHK